jgi:hypothetical protein
LPSRGSTPPPSNKPVVAHPASESSKGDLVNGSLSSHSHRVANGKSEPVSPTDPLGESQASSDEAAQSSDIAKLQQDISKSQTAVQELRDQLSAFQSQAFASHASLRLLLDEQRSKKKQDDSTRAELKMKTKTLEENKRHADAGKRDAEKKLKAAQAAHDSAANRMQRLATEMENLKKKMQKGGERLQRAKEEVQQTEGECNLDIEKKRAGAKEMEEGVATLSAKTKELEEILAKEKERLVGLKDEVEKGRELHRQQHNAWLMATQAQAQAQQQRSELVTVGAEVSDLPGDQQQQLSRSSFGPITNQAHDANPLRGHTMPPTFSPFEPPNPFTAPRRPSAEFVPMFEALPVSNTASRLRSLSLGEVSSLQTPLALNPKVNESRSSLKPGDDGFSPFDVDDRERALPMRDNGSFTSLNMAAASLLPANLVNSIETENSVGSLNTNRDHPDTRTESRWRTSMWPFRSDNLSKSGPAGDATKRGFDPFESQRVAPTKSLSPLESRLSATETTKPSTQVMRRWFSRSTSASTNSEPMPTMDVPSQITSAPEITSASKSRLNPDAKVFSLPKGRSLLSSALWTPEGVNMPPPTSIPPGTMHLLQIPEHLSSLTSTSSLPILSPASPPTSTVTTTSAPKPRFRNLFTSPFAPSPAEREALQRALEKNLSYDRISQGSEGSGEGSSALRLPSSPFGLPQTSNPLFDVDEEADSGWGNVLKATRSKRQSFGEAIARQTTR